MNSMSLLSEVRIVSPMIVLMMTALILLLAEVCAPKGAAKGNGQVRGYFMLMMLLATLCVQVFFVGFSHPASTIFGGSLYADSLALFFQFFIVLGSLLAAMIGIGTLQREGSDAPSEFYALYLMSVIGAMIFSSAAEFITLFLGLEIMSMALYCLCGSAIHGAVPAMKRSAEAALKYFLLGSFSSAFLLYGVALLYGLTGSTELSVISAYAASTEHATIFFLALGFVLIGIIFKIGAVPFHFWAPDVYQGSPTFVTAYMACIIKASAVAVALRVFWVAFRTEVLIWSGVIWAIAIATVVLGNVVALTQRSIKRMLAYSSIAHGGYMLTALLAPGDSFGGGPALLFYLVAYTAMTMGAFGVVLLVTAPFSDKNHPDDITRFNGLGYRRPVLAAAMTLFMLSLAGIPPGMAGLLGKFYLFSAAIKANYVGLAIIGVLMSAVSCYYYLRVVVAMYFVEAEEKDGEIKDLPAGVCLTGALVICAVSVVVLGLFPSLLYDSMNSTTAVLTGAPLAFAAR